MKKLLLSIFVLISVSSFGQKVDSVKNALQVNPVVVNALNGDTIFQIKVENMWSGLYDTTVNTYVVAYDRKGKKVGEKNILLPYSFLVAWKQKPMVDDYVALFLGLTKRK